ncbi:hypothetical protein L1049_012976 [Liquidambar formosana]|uniref:Late embryogenesis abundant protein LEA-2 subgroup domain-containing protein n=1 Tax=Liquidambar formosana TaxID=63359 RepID=A0AAP0RJT1_LIQFO
MEGQKPPVIGYPLQFSHGQSPNPLSDNPTAQPPHSTTTTTTAAANVVQLPPIVGHQDQPRPRRRRSQICSGTNCGTLAAILALLAFAAIGAFLGNKYSIKSPVFRLNSASLSSFNLFVDSQITANWNVTFYVRNPNRWASIAYDVTQASVFYEDQLLSAGTISPFQQGRREQTLVTTASLDAKSVHVDDWVKTFILDNLTSAGGVLDFNVKVEALVRLHPGTLSEARGRVTVSCNVKIQFSPDTTSGTMVDGPRECRTHLDDHEHVF